MTLGKLGPFSPQPATPYLVDPDINSLTLWAKGLILLGLIFLTLSD